MTLEGDVDYWTQREDAEKAIRNLTGVRAVTNRMEVEPRPVPTDVRARLLHR